MFHTCALGKLNSKLLIPSILIYWPITIFIKFQQVSLKFAESIRNPKKSNPLWKEARSEALRGLTEDSV